MEEGSGEQTGREMRGGEQKGDEGSRSADGSGVEGG